MMLLRCPFPSPILDRATMEDPILEFLRSQARNYRCRVCGSNHKGSQLRKIGNHNNKLIVQVTCGRCRDSFFLHVEFAGSIVNAVEEVSHVAAPSPKKRAVPSPCSPRMLMAKVRLAITSLCISVDRSTETRISKGSSDCEAKALTVMPCIRPAAVVVMMVTPLAKCPMTWRKDAFSRGWVTPIRYGNVACATPRPLYLGCPTNPVGDP